LNLDEFKALLKKAEFSKKTFSEDVEIALSTVNGWDRQTNYLCHFGLRSI